MGGVYNLINFNMYHYARNNPVKYVDPDGKYITSDGKHITKFTTYIDFADDLNFTDEQKADYIDNIKKELHKLYGDQMEIDIQETPADESKIDKTYNQIHVQDEVIDLNNGDSVLGMAEVGKKEMWLRSDLFVIKSNGKDNSRTVAHEFGHLAGADHPLTN